MLEDKTTELIDYLFPSIQLLKKRTKARYETVDTILHNIVIFGSQGSGKTELARKLCEEAVKLYESRRVSCLLFKDPLSVYSLEESLTPKPVQMIFFDDATLVSVEKEKLRDFFMLRHIWKKTTNRSNGLIITMFGTHRFHGLLPEFRTNVDAIIWRTLPMNPYDVSVCRGFVGEDGLETLSLIERKRRDDEHWKGVSVFNTKFTKGICYFPLATKNYFKEVLPNSTEAILIRWEKALGLRK